MALENNFWKAEFCAQSKDNYLGPKRMNGWIKVSRTPPVSGPIPPSYFLFAAWYTEIQTTEPCIWGRSWLTLPNQALTQGGKTFPLFLGDRDCLIQAPSSDTVLGVHDFFLKAVIPLKSLFKYVPFLIHSYQLIFKSACWSSYKRDIVPRLFYLPVFETSAI